MRNSRRAQRQRWGAFRTSMLSWRHVRSACPRRNSQPAVCTRSRLEDWDLIGPHLEAVTLKERQVIEVPAKPITHAYFLEIGVASVVAVDAEDHRIEVGVIGYEGMTGVPLVMGDNRAQHSTYMQIGGTGHRIPAERFVAAPSPRATACAP